MLNLDFLLISIEVKFNWVKTFRLNVSFYRGGKCLQREEMFSQREEICHIWGVNMSYLRGANELGSPDT